MDNRSLSREQLHDLHLKLVLQQIINHPATTRVEIAHKLSMRKSTISALYNTLVDKNLLMELGQGNASNLGGRKPMMIKINPMYGYTVTFDLSDQYLFAMANYIDTETIKFEKFEVMNQSIEQIIEKCHFFLKHISTDVEIINGLKGICFSIHGTTEHNRILFSPWLNMNKIDLVSLFKARYRVPILLENEANLSAIYVRDFSIAEHYKNFVTISIHHGLGAGIILNKELIRGEEGSVGELGQLLINLETKKTTQTVESLCSENAIFNQIRNAKKIPTLDQNEAVNLFKNGDQDTKRILERTCGIMASLIYNVVMILNPKAVFLNSLLITRLPQMLNEIRKDYRDLTKKKLSIELIDDSDSATLLGGCSLITHHVLGLDDYDLRFTKS